MSFICHIHNYTEYNEFSAFNPSKCTHTWSSGQPTLRRPGSSWGFGALLKGLTSVVDTSCQSRDSNPQPWVTSGFKSNALSIRPQLHCDISTLNLIWAVTGSHCNLIKRGVTWAFFGSLKTILAAAFWISCRGFIVHAGGLHIDREEKWSKHWALRNPSSKKLWNLNLWEVRLKPQGHCSWDDHISGWTGGSGG